MSIRLSKASKMPCASWSLQAQETCPGSYTADGSLVDACQGCYASEGMYRMPNVKSVRANNRIDWRRIEWENDMVATIKPKSLFRWFDSGDVYHPHLALKIFDVMLRTPNTQHWLPTRTYKMPRILPILLDMNKLANVVVRFSSDAIDGTNTTPDGTEHSSIIDRSDRIDMRRKGACTAYQRDGKCGKCRQCWDKSIPVITYPQHGQKMARQEQQKEKVKKVRELYSLSSLKKRIET